PYDVESDLHSLITRIREQVPTPPTTAWKTDSGIRSARRTRWLWREGLPRCPIDRELETIVLVCLRKERERRYQSAGELARDIRRYLAGEPIDAKRDSLPYVLKKWLWRRRKPIATGLLVGAVVLAAIVWGIWYRAHQQAQLDRAAARAILAGFVQNLPGALGQLEASNTAVKAQVKEQGRAGVVSTSFADRVTSARPVFLLDPDAFWQSVDGGPLWTGGEWLEVCRADWPDRTAAVRQLAERAKSGTERQKYAAFCLLGQIARPEDKVTDLCVGAARGETHAGVAAAAMWAAGRLGRQARLVSGGDVFVDDLSAMTFVRVPGCDDYRMGSPETEAERHPNEDPAVVVKTVPAVFLSQTEVTVAAISGLLRDPVYAVSLGWADSDLSELNEQIQAEMQATASDHGAAAPVQGKTFDLIGQLAQWLTERSSQANMLAMSADNALAVPAQHVSLDLAQRYCEWLNSKAAGAGLPQRYELPTEAEWEWACRGGNTGRFCFGSSADYLKYFANCNGDMKSHVVATRMPNWYGLFDMHGGVWEWTSDRYKPTEEELSQFPEWKGKTLFAKRGGAFYSPAVRCRSAQRNCAEANSVDFYTGFRLVLKLERR
ncbi:MAG: SUMF1/EgtB/PvdO family nonheme iron enzyme, partial [Phycisphaerae bacterium]|nr:SUMF1/EgtB/PvdO family nonheme iron enzyme [Phycisphaerae bacterium]